MKPAGKDRIAFSIMFLSVTLALGLMAGCGGGGGSDDGRAAGSVSFSLVMPDEGANSLIAAAVDCGESGIATVEAEVLDNADNLLAAGGPWQCTQHSGLISGVEPGEDRMVLLLARDSEGEVNFTGFSESFDVIAGQTTSAGEITLFPERKPVAQFSGFPDFQNDALVIVLDGSESFDPDGDPLTYRWTIVDQPAESDSFLSDPTDVSPIIFNITQGTYRVRLIVNDGLLDSDPVEQDISIEL